MRTPWKWLPIVIGLAAMSFSTTVAEESTTPTRNVVVEHHAVAIEDVCAWPNLPPLADGTIAAIIHNRPSHTMLPADIDCWSSGDHGKTWKRRAVAAPRTLPDSNRCHAAAGLARNGDLVVISTGWHRPAGRPPRVLSALVCRSGDGGRAWTVDDAFPQAPGGGVLIPFGDIIEGADGALRAALYTASPERAYVLRSDDDGRTWSTPRRIDTGINECALLHLGRGAWLCAARTASHPEPQRGQEVRLYRSADDAETWEDAGLVTGHRQHPAHLARLTNGRILLTYGSRRRDDPAVEARLSEDDGRSWSDPLRLADVLPDDFGYPSSVALADGAIVTAYYAKRTALRDGYHMAVVRWRLRESEE